MALRKEVEDFILLHNKPCDYAAADLAIKKICEKYNEQLANNKTLENDIVELARFLSIAKRRKDRPAIFDCRSAIMVLLRCAADWGLTLPNDLLSKFESLKLIDDLSLADFARKTLNSDFFAEPKNGKSISNNKPRPKRKRGRPKQHLKDCIKDNVNKELLINILHKYLDNKEPKYAVLIYEAIKEAFFTPPYYMPRAAFEEEFGIPQMSITNSISKFKFEKYTKVINNYNKKILEEYNKQAKL